MRRRNRRQNDEAEHRGARRATPTTTGTQHAARQQQSEPHALAHATAAAGEESTGRRSTRVTRSAQVHHSEATHLGTTTEPQREELGGTSSAALRRSPRHAHDAPTTFESRVSTTTGQPHSGGIQSAEKQHDDPTTEGGSTACAGPGQAVEARPPAPSPKMSAPSIFPTYLPPMYV